MNTIRNIWDNTAARYTLYMGACVGLFAAFLQVVDTFAAVALTR